MSARHSPCHALVRARDVDGFFGLALDNLVQLLLIDTLCRFVLEFPPELVYGRVLPGAAVSLLVGNLFYAWQALRLARATGRSDVCALPYGINTVSLFAYVFLVMLPAKLAAAAAGAADPARVAWHAGLVACLGTGLIELVGAVFAERLRKITPRAALLSTLAGIAIERRFLIAACWSCAGAALSALGLIHSYRFTPGDTALDLTPGWPWAMGYACMGLCFAAAKWLTVPGSEHAP